MPVCSRSTLVRYLFASFCFSCCGVTARGQSEFAEFSRSFADTQQEMLKKYCVSCHSTAESQGELDLERFQSVADIRADVVRWQRVVEMLDDREMPPKDAPQQLSDSDRTSLRDWVRGLLDADARANAGDPGPVVLRRLNNAEFNYTVADLTGVDLQPAREFPEDSAAGEGFTNVGNALVMSPALVQKYLDAAKDVAAHAMLLPQGIEFSPSTTSRDWTDQRLNDIRRFYSRYSDSSGATAVNLQGVQCETNGGGRLPIERYLAATIEHREALRSGSISLSDVARVSNLNEKYLSLLWNALDRSEPSILLEPLRKQWNESTSEDVGSLSTAIGQWQQSLWRFTTVGHIGKRDGPPAWQVPVQPVAVRQEFRVAVPDAQDGMTSKLYLATTDAGDGHEHDVAVWENARFVAPGQPDLLLRDVRRAWYELHEYRQRVIASTAASLRAAAIVARLNAEEITAERIAAIAEEHHVEPAILQSWCRYLGIGAGAAEITGHLTQRMESASGYDFIKGWVGPNALSVVANSSDQLARIPGDMQPHSIGVHPAPNVRMTVAWRSPVSGTVTMSSRVQRAHIGCGNGVSWQLELRRGRTVQSLANGAVGGNEVAQTNPIADIQVNPGDVIALVIGPRDGNHSCDLTAIDLTIASSDKEWNLTRDVAADLLTGNPHRDSHGNEDVWHFVGEPDSGSNSEIAVPAGSLLAQWQSATTDEARIVIEARLQSWMEMTAVSANLSTNDASAKPASGQTALPAPESPDGVLLKQLTSLNGPLFSAMRRELLNDGAAPLNDQPSNNSDAPATLVGLDQAAFGSSPDGTTIDPAALCVAAPAVIELNLPAELVAGSEFVASAVLHATLGAEGSVQMQVLTEQPEQRSGAAASTRRNVGGKSTWSDGDPQQSFDSPILANEGSQARARLLADFDEFRSLFPIALCYTKIVPVDEVVTLTLYYREDHELKRLMLDDGEAAELDQLWADMHTVSRSPLALVDAYEQLWQFATQDADPSAFTPMREGILQRAEDFRSQQAAAEPVHVESVLAFANRAWRRPTTAAESSELELFYAHLRGQELDHDAAIRMMLARVLVAPEFLYRSETSANGVGASIVTSHELATRLSYFLTSSLPDGELRAAADDGSLLESDVLAVQTRRLLSGPQARRLAIEFGCQWLHVRDFDQLDEKSEQHYPDFKDLRGDMYEEVIRCFEDLFQNNGSVLSLIESDHTFVNNRLADFYGFPTEPEDAWRRVEDTGRSSRGGILTMAATLSKHSGASRTSPILRGNWVSEFLLGDKLPRPPKDVPVLPEVAPADLTERQLVERHSSDAACAKCHRRIDGFGFALEEFDTIGRRRTQDAHGHAIDDSAVLLDGTNVRGVDGLRSYLLRERRDDFLRTFCRRLLGYALGRSVQLSDEPLIDELITQLETNEFRIHSAVESIVLSPQFRMIRNSGWQ